MSDPLIRPVRPADVPALRGVIDATELFPSEMLDEMIAPFFEEASEAVWLLAEQEGVPVAVCFAELERMTDGTWNALLLAVDPAHQGNGIGTALMRRLEAMLTERGVRVMLVETSGTAEFSRSRSFYSRLGYREEARIRDYYAAGDDKIVFHHAFS